MHANNKRVIIVQHLKKNNPGRIVRDEFLCQKVLYDY